MTSSPSWRGARRQPFARCREKASNAVDTAARLAGSRTSASVALRRQANRHSLSLSRERMPASLQLALLIAILLPAGKIVASISTRYGIPAILGELLVGVVAGPGCLNILHMRLFSGTPAADAFLLIAQIGGLILMFIAGLENDIDRMREASVTAFLVALSGVIWPFFLGAGVAHLLGLPWSSAWFLGGALTATSVSISARTLMDAGKMTTPEASVILGAAVIDDVMG